MMQHSSATGSSSGRRRPPRACSNCAKRKVSCDKIRPSCTRCVRQKLRCQYAFGGSSSDGAVVIIDETPSVIAENATVEGRAADHAAIPARLQRLGSLIEELVPNQCVDSASSEERSSMALVHDVKHHSFLYNGSQTKARYLSPSSFALISNEISSINDLLRAQQRQSIKNTDEAELDPSRRSSASPIASSHNGSDRSAHLYGDIFPRAPTWSLLDYRSSSGGSTSSNEPPRELPTREQCDLLIWAYMVGFHPMMPLIDVPAFFSSVHQLHEKRACIHPDANLPTHFMCLLAAVLFAGSVVCPRSRLQEAFGHRSREQLSSRLYKFAISAIRGTDFPQIPSLQSLAAYMIVDTTWLREEQPLTCCSFVGVAYRVAQILGLHEDPINFQDVPEQEIRLRRNLWWNLIAIDAQVALAAGLPPLIPDRAHDVQPVSEEPSTRRQNSDELTISASSPLVKSPTSLFISGKYAFYKQASNFLHAIHKHVLDENDLGKILALTQGIRRDMEAYKAAITAVQYPSNTESEPGEEANSNPFFADLAKMVLSMYAAKPYAIMYGPLRRHGLLESLRQKEPNAMMNCREYLHRFLQLTQKDEFQPWHWSWPGRHQPLHSIMALITNLDESPDPAFPKETRELIDLALSLCGGESASSGVTSREDGEPDVRPLQDPGGQEVWNFIRRARDKCWERAGLDPDELHCPRSVRQIRFQGFAFSESVDEFLQTPSEIDWNQIPFSGDEWAFLNQNALDLDWELDTHMQ